MSRRLAIALLIGALTPGCEQEDVGSACPDMDVPNQGEATLDGDVRRAEGSEVVEYNTAFPCDDIVCVATLGRGSYCTRECAGDEYCPQGFECRVVMTYGPFAGRRYCTWARCDSDGDCGNPWLNACTAVPELGLTEPVKLCESRDPDVRY